VFAGGRISHPSTDHNECNDGAFYKAVSQYAIGREAIGFKGALEGWGGRRIVVVCVAPPVDRKLVLCECSVLSLPSFAMMVTEVMCYAYCFVSNFRPASKINVSF
jgi:hypothetical protein